jgi:hypothetical protein
VVTAYLDQRTEGERFADWVVRAEESVLRGEGLDNLGQRLVEVR